MLRAPIIAVRGSRTVVMRSTFIALFLSGIASFAAQAQPCVPDTTPDWMTSVPPYASSAQVRPADCALVRQSPPDFSWPDLSIDAAYQVTLTYPDGSSRSKTVAGNWINWDEVLPAGSYQWQVLVNSASGSQQSRLRRFTVDANAAPFLVPDWTTLFDRAAAKPHPRALPDAATAQSMLDQRQAEFGWLQSQVSGLLAAPVQAEPVSGSALAITTQARDECKRTLDAALAWLVSNNEAYLADALRRAFNLASWDPHGVTSYANVDQASGEIAWTLTLVYDWLFPQLDANQKNALLAPILARATDMYNDVIGSRARVAIHPYDSHGNVTLAYLGVISILLAGDIPEAAVGMRDTLPLAILWTSPWGGEDGGFGNGTAYATWSTGDLLLSWYTLRWTVGIDIAQKAWTRNYANFLAYFIPPGTPAGVFGDGAEHAVVAEPWARLGKAYTLFAPSPLGRWYASQLSGEDPARLELLLAPPADPDPAPYPADTPNAALFPSIGWTAMHSSLQDPERVSVYFKASPFGSYNHSHADQNSFVINAGGQPLAIDSGYYDDYKTPHWWQWYKQTRAHNAITFDGGQGQVVFEESDQLGPGTITGFLHQPEHDIVSGDATQAYGGALQEARRSLVYLRPNLILVYDRLASDIPRQWEWNIHAANAMSAISNRKISIANNGQSLCVDMLAGPTMQFAQSDQFAANPAGSWSPQWHGMFVSVQSLPTAEFIALLDVGCTATPAGASKVDGVWTVNVGARQVTIDGSGAITVQ